MKRWISILLALALLCGAASAQAAKRPSLSQSAREKTGMAKVDEAMVEDLRALLDIVLSCDEDAVLAAADAQHMPAEQVSQMLTVIANNGEVLNIRMINVSLQPDGWYEGVFAVEHSTGTVTYDVAMDPEGKLQGLQVRTQAKGLEDAPESELQDDMDYEAIAEDVVRMAAAGEYEQLLANTVPELFEGVTEETFAGYMDIFGEAEMYSYYSAAEKQGYIQCIYEVRHKNGLALWQIVLDGEGRIAGFYMQEKMMPRTEIEPQDYRKWQTAGRGYLDMLLQGDYDSFLSTAQGVGPEAEQSLREMFEEIGEFDHVGMHDLYVTGDLVSVEFLVSFENADMLMRFILDQDGQIQGFLNADAVWLQ